MEELEYFRSYPLRVVLGALELGLEPVEVRLRLL